MLLGLTAIPSAFAQEFPDATSRNYTLDLYRGTAVGSAKIVGMGGVAAATAQGSSGMLTNPAAAGVRPTTSNETWDWDWHIVTESPRLGNDFDNNGLDDQFGDDVNYDPNATFGLVLQYKDWGIGITALNQTIESTFVDGMDETVVATNAGIAKISLAHYIFDGQLVIGAGARIVGMSIDSRSGAAPDPQTLLELTGANLEVGALWKPKRQDFRVGGSLSLPVVADQVEVENCDPLDCAGYILPGKLKVPWSATVGFAARHSESPWNMRYRSEWRDEKALLWAVDLVLTGTTKRGAGFEEFAQHRVQPSGRKHSLSLRGGVEYEWLPGTLRVRGGSYFEPSRFKDANGNDVPGRVHLTVGLDWHFYSFSIWDYNYRAQVSTWADGAKKFAVSGISVGFWQ
jgi:hypothetical protein